MIRTFNNRTPGSRRNGCLGLLALGLAGGLSAHPPEQQPSAQPASAQVVPEHEHDISRREGVDGPTANRGIEAVKSLGHVSLKGEIDNPDERILRAREIVIAPGGVVAVHQHDQRPGLAYILEGELVEHRNDADQPLLRGPGAISFEKTGVTHWWENRGEINARAIVVDIVPEPSAEPGHDNR